MSKRCFKIRDCEVFEYEDGYISLEFEGIEMLNDEDVSNVIKNLLMVEENLDIVEITEEEYLKNTEE